MKVDDGNDEIQFVTVPNNKIQQNNIGKLEWKKRYYS